jgi:hypothetical protein
MTRHWAIWPYHPNDRAVFTRAWDFDRENGTIAIGWAVGDLTGLNRREVARRVQAVYSDQPGATGMLWNFYNSIDIGDEVLALGSRTSVLAFGTVTRRAFHDPSSGQSRVGDRGDNKMHLVGVHWHRLGPVQVTGPMLARRTLSELQPGRYAEILRDADLSL